ADDAISARVLGLVEARIREREERAALFRRAAREGCDAEARADCDRSALEGDGRRVDEDAHALGELGAALERDVARDDEALFAAVATDDVLDAERAREACGDLAQYGVACGVTV